MGRLGAKDARPLGSGGGYVPPKDRGGAGGNKIGPKFLRGLCAFLPGRGRAVSDGSTAAPASPRPRLMAPGAVSGAGGPAAGGGLRRPLDKCDLALFKLAPRLQIALREGL